MGDIVELRQPEDVDHVIEVYWDARPRWTAYVMGVGKCPHEHVNKDHAELCMSRMRRWLDHQERRSKNGLQADGTIHLHRNGPGPRPTRRPW